MYQEMHPCRASSTYSVKINTSLPMMRECIRTLPRGGMYWEIHPPRPERFPKGGDFAPRGPRDFPRAKPEGNLEGRGVQNPRPREISRAEGDVFPNASRLEAVYVHSLSISREVLILWCVFHLKLERSPSQCIGLH